MIAGPQLVWSGWDKPSRQDRCSAPGRGTSTMQSSRSAASRSPTVSRITAQLLADFGVRLAHDAGQDDSRPGAGGEVDFDRIRHRRQPLQLLAAAPPPPLPYEGHRAHRDAHGASLTIAAFPNSRQLSRRNRSVVGRGRGSGGADRRRCRPKMSQTLAGGCCLTPGPSPVTDPPSRPPLVSSSIFRNRRHPSGRPCSRTAARRGRRASTPPPPLAPPAGPTRAHIRSERLACHGL
jgi:hypothetical protein